jgi:hypothetical protein
MQPVDMLKKCRAHFAEEAEKFLVAERYAGTVWETNVAKEFGEAARRFVADIDATLRDWG